MKLFLSRFVIRRQLGRAQFAAVALVSFVAMANFANVPAKKGKMIAPKFAAQFGLNYPSTNSIASGPDFSGQPLGPGGGGVAFQAGDRLDQTFVGTGACTADSSEWVFHMDNFTEGNGFTNDFDVYINDVKIGSYSMPPGPEANKSFDLVFSHPGLAIGAAKLSIVATSTVPSGGGSWNWIAGGTVTF